MASAILRQVASLIVAPSFMLVSSLVAPYTKGKIPSAEDFIPIEDKAPQHPTQIAETIRRMAADLGKATQ